MPHGIRVTDSHILHLSINLQNRLTWLVSSFSPFLWRSLSNSIWSSFLCRARSLRSSKPTVTAAEVTVLCDIRSLAWPPLASDSSGKDAGLSDAGLKCACMLSIIFSRSSSGICVLKKEESYSFSWYKSTIKKHSSSNNIKWSGTLKIIDHHYVRQETKHRARNC